MNDNYVNRPYISSDFNLPIGNKKEAGYKKENGNVQWKLSKRCVSYSLEHHRRACQAQWPIFISWDTPKRFFAQPVFNALNFLIWHFHIPTYMHVKLLILACHKWSCVRSFSFESWSWYAALYLYIRLRWSCQYKIIFYRMFSGNYCNRTYQRSTRSNETIAV